MPYVVLVGGVKVRRAVFVWTFRRNCVESGTVLLGQDGRDRGPSGVKRVRRGLLHVGRTLDFSGIFGYFPQKYAKSAWGSDEYKKAGHQGSNPGHSRRRWSS